jgi:VanZ family protein
LPSFELLRRWLPVLLWAGLIFAFSTNSFAGERTAGFIVPLLSALFPNAGPRDLLALHYAVRKLGHFSEYFVLSLLLYRALRGGERWSPRAAALALLLASLYAASDEVHQLFVPGRTGSAADTLIDVSGAAAGQGMLAARALVQRGLVRA